MAKASTPQSLSPIQNHILSLLKGSLSLRYGQMKQKQTPNDLFNYHLQFLLKKGYVQKKELNYSLTPAGIKHIADPIIPASEKEVLSLYKLNVLTIVSRKTKGQIEILNQIRNSHPSFGKIGVMGGVVKKGETTEAAAKRKLKVETGLDASFKIVGLERRMLYKNNELFSDVLFPIAYANSSAGELQDTAFGKNMWVSINQAIKNESDPNDSIQSLIPVLKAIKKGTLNKLPFFYNETIQYQ